MKNNKIYITGIGSISSLGYENEQIWENLKNEKSTICIKTEWKNEKIKPTVFGKPEEVDFNEEINWREKFQPNRYSQLGLLACKNAINDANLQLKEEDNEVGLIIETCLAATEYVEDYLDDLYSRGVARVRPLKFTKTVANTVLGDISRHFKLNGQSSLLYNENSISYGFDLIKKGVADIVICGGVDHFADFRVLSEQKTDLLVNAKQYNTIEELLNSGQKIQENFIGEGSAFIVLESEKSVKQRKAKIYAELLDYHSNFDYENVDTYKRESYILNDAYDRFKGLIDAKENIAFLSAYATQIQSTESESEFLNELKKEHQVKVINHKTYTGDMKAASNVMGVCISSQLLKNEQTKDTSKYAFISNCHEGGSSSHFLLKQCS